MAQRPVAQLVRSKARRVDPGKHIFIGIGQQNPIECIIVSGEMCFLFGEVQ